MLRQLSADPEVFPHPETALTDPPGLLAIGGDLQPARLLAAYQQGIFPWFGRRDPLLWWSPDPRALFDPAHIHISRSLRRFLRRHCRYRCSFNQDFQQVIELCAALRPNAVWITPTMQAAYQRLHELGHAHSVEVWDGDMLVGGLYGVSVGALFCGESMFHRADHASKVALLALAQHLRPAGLQAIDAQLPNAHLARLGAFELPRQQFLQQLSGWGKHDIPASFYQSQKIAMPGIGN